jgi:VWFA-related protein
MHSRLFSCLFALLVGVAPAGVIAQGSTPSSGTTAPAAQTATPAAGQADGKTPTLSLNANLVNLPVIVRDKKGALVQNLTKADFTLSVDGHPQVIRYFDRDQNLPLTLGLLVDTSQSQRSVLDEEREASSSFLDGMLAAPPDRAPDRAFLIQFAREVELLQDLTSSRPRLQAAIKEIGTPNPNERSSDDDDTNNSNNNSNGNSGGYHRGGTALYDAVYLSANDLMLKQQGRKAVVILSDGVDRNSKETLNRAIEAAQRADMIIYAIYFKGQEQHNYNNNRNDNGGGYPRFPGGGGGYPGGGGGYPGGGGGYPGGGRRGGGQQQPQENRVDGKKILQQMADETGGRLFEVKGGKDKVIDIYNQIAEELRSQYRLGYTPDAAITGDGYHQIDLKIPAQKNLKIQTRDGYYTGK